MQWSQWTANPKTVYSAPFVHTVTHKRAACCLSAEHGSSVSDLINPGPIDHDQASPVADRDLTGPGLHAHAHLSFARARGLLFVIVGELNKKQKQKQKQKQNKKNTARGNIITSSAVLPWRSACFDLVTKGGSEKKIAPTATKKFLWLLVQFFFTAPLWQRAQTSSTT